MEKLIQKKKFISLKHVLNAYLIVSLLLIIILSLFTKLLAERWIFLTVQKYDLASANFSQMDAFIFNFSNFVSSYNAIIVSIIVIPLVTQHFYKKRLSEPIAIFESAMTSINEGNYEHECVYEASDEMGRLCEGFENMRKELVNKQKQLWDNIERQKQVNKAFAHDLKTPLTVLKGYTEILENDIPHDKLDILKRQVDRLTHFSNTMQKIFQTESQTLNTKKTSIRSISETIKEIIIGMQSQCSAIIELKTVTDERVEVSVDMHFVLQVFENLLSNALRFGDHVNVTIDLDERYSLLQLFVTDNGPGFSKAALANATRPYFTEADSHLGIGLSLSKAYCEKHEGSLSITNAIEKGAIVCANFHYYKDMGIA